MSHKRNSKIVTPKDEWGTPQWLFDLLDQEFHFDCDAAATFENSKCNFLFNKEDSNALALEDWMGCDGSGNPIKIFWLNCPYSAALINAFMKKAYEESQKGATVVCLVPVSGDRWWINYALKAQEIRYIRGRVKFVGYDDQGNQVNGSPMFSSCIVIFKKESRRTGYDMPYIGNTIEQPKKGSG